MSLVRCPACDRKVGADASYCIHCQASMDGAEPASPSPSPPPPDDDEDDDEMLSPAPPVTSRGRAPRTGESRGGGGGRRRGRRGTGPRRVRGGGARQTRHSMEGMAGRYLRRTLIKAGVAVVVIPIVALIAIGVGGAKPYREWAEERWTLPPGTYEYLEFDDLENGVKYEIDSNTVIDAYVCWMKPVSLMVADMLTPELAAQFDSGEVNFTYLREVSQRRTRHYASGRFSASGANGILIVNRSKREARVRLTVLTN